MKVQTECIRCGHDDESGNSFDSEGFCGQCRGVAERMSFAEYLRVDAAHATGLKWIGVSPKYYKWRKGNDTDNDTLRSGRASHTLTLEPGKFVDDYIVFDEVNKAGKVVRGGNVWKEFREKHQCKTILTPKQLDNAMLVAKAVRDDPMASALLSNGEVEKSITWIDKETGLLCKGRIDHVDTSVDDLKTAKDVSPAAFARAALSLDYFMQLAFYRDGLAECTGKVLPAKIVAVGNTGPRDVVVYDLSEDSLAYGRRRYRLLLNMLRKCLDDDHWPGVEPNGATLELPAWAGDKELQVPTFNGEPMSF